MKKVLFVFNHPAPYKVNLLNMLSDNYDLDVVFERAKNSDRNSKFYDANEYKFNLLPIKAIKCGRENAISSDIIKIIKKTHYDLIIMNGYSTFCEMVTINYLIKNNIPYLLYVNGGFAKQKESIIKRLLKKKYISNAKWTMCPDENSKCYLEYYGANKENIFIYPYSTIFDRNIVTEPTPSNEKKTFISSGQLIARKDYLGLIRVWSKNCPHYELMIAGDGPQRRKIEKYISKNNIKNIELLGYLAKEELLNLYKKCDAFVFSSKEDIYGHVINEAMSQGLPVVSTSNVNAAKKLIKNGKNGYIVESIYEDNFIECLEKINKATMFEECIKVAKENTYEKMYNVHVEILAGLK